MGTGSTITCFTVEQDFFVEIVKRWWYNDVGYLVPGIGIKFTVYNMQYKGYTSKVGIIFMESKKNSKKDIQVRLRRIEGQVKGIEKMMESNTCCKDVLVQVAAVRAAVNKVGALILQNYAKECMIDDEGHRVYEAKIDELVATLTMFMK